MSTFFSLSQSPQKDVADNCVEIYYAPNLYYVYNKSLNKVIVPPSLPYYDQDLKCYRSIVASNGKNIMKYYELNGTEIIGKQEFTLSNLTADGAFSWYIKYKYPKEEFYKIEVSFYNANGTPVKVDGRNLVLDQGELIGLKNDCFKVYDAGGHWDYSFVVRKGIFKRNVKYLAKITLKDENGHKIPLKNDKTLTFIPGQGSANWIVR